MICRWPSYPNCWRWDEWPRRSEFDLDRNEDGVDLVAEKTDGRLIAIQVKARSGDAISPTDIQKLVGTAPDEIFGERWFVTTAKQTARIEKVEARMIARAVATGLSEPLHRSPSVEVSPLLTLMIHQSRREHSPDCVGVAVEHARFVPVRSTPPPT